MRHLYLILPPWPTLTVFDQKQQEGETQTFTGHKEYHIKWDDAGWNDFTSAQHHSTRLCSAVITRLYRTLYINTNVELEVGKLNVLFSDETDAENVYLELKRQLGVVTVCCRAPTHVTSWSIKHTYLYKERKITTIYVFMDSFSFLFITQ